MEGTGVGQRRLPSYPAALRYIYILYHPVKFDVDGRRQGPVGIINDYDLFFESIRLWSLRINDYVLPTSCT